MSDRPERFWERAETVERFAAREPDDRLLELLAESGRPLRVLDLGCAAGRNVVALAERGHDVEALDASEAMVARTRERLAELVGAEEARRRVGSGRMDDLSRFSDGRFDLVVALGVYHNARDREEWDRTLAESVRVLAPEGRILVSVFTPETDLTGEGIRPVPGEPHVYEGLPAGRVFFVEAEVLDAEMTRHGLVPAAPTTTVRRESGVELRVTVKGLYRKLPSARPSRAR